MNFKKPISKLFAFFIIAVFSLALVALVYYSNNFGKDRRSSCCPDLGDDSLCACVSTSTSEPISTSEPWGGKILDAILGPDGAYH